MERHGAQRRADLGGELARRLRLAHGIEPPAEVPCGAHRRQARETVSPGLAVLRGSQQLVARLCGLRAEAPLGRTGAAEARQPG